MEIVLGWIVLSVVAGVIAGSRGRNGGGYFLLSLILSPLVGIILAAAMPVKRPRDPVPQKRCPRCAEMVQAPALICRHCGHEFAPAGSQPHRFRGINFWLYPDRRVGRLVGGQPMTWPNPSAFEEWANANRRRLTVWEG